MTRYDRWDFAGGGKEIDTDVPSGLDVFRREPDDDTERYDAAAEHSPTGAWPENQQQQEEK